MQALQKAALGTSGPPLSLAPPAASLGRRALPRLFPCPPSPALAVTSAAATRGHHLPATNSKIYDYCEAFVNIQLHNIRQRSTSIHIALCNRRYFLRGIGRDQRRRAVDARIHQRGRGNISPIFFVSYSLGKRRCTQHDPRRTPPGAPRGKPNDRARWKKKYRTLDLATRFVLYQNLKYTQED